MAERSISSILFDLGVTHTRDAHSTTDSCHSLFYAGRFIGRYSAHECCLLIAEHGVGDEDDVTVYPDIIEMPNSTSTLLANDRLKTGG